VLWIALAEAVYGAWMGTQLERYVMVQVALLNLAVGLFPWGWRAQLVVVSGSGAGYTLGAPSMGTSDALAFGAVILGINAVVTVFSARFHDRFRRHGFIARHARIKRPTSRRRSTGSPRALAPRRAQHRRARRHDAHRRRVARLRLERGVSLGRASQGISAGGAGRARTGGGRGDPQLEFGTEFGSAVGHVAAGHVLEIRTAASRTRCRPG
jgi:hypothetical protein